MISVYTVGDLCKKCYSCVRSCPTNAIEVHEGQADIIEEYCISCGQCVTVCSQEAKKIISSIEEVLSLLDPDRNTVTYAMLAPSFPAAFLNTMPEDLVGALKELGFSGVFEVAFGADLVSYAYYRRYQKMLDRDKDDFIISSPCPSVIFYIEKIFPELSPYLEDIASPMEAMARIIRGTIDQHGKIVFIGPCVAKKEEAERSKTVDEVITFAELKEIFTIKGIKLGESEPSDFDKPKANLGRIYPVTGGLLKAASIDADLLESPISVVEGHERVTDILGILSHHIKEGQQVSYRFYDLLFCEGCIGGPVMLNDLTFYDRKKFILNYIKQRPIITNINEWSDSHRNYLDIDLTVNFHPVKRDIIIPPEEEISKILAMTSVST